MPEVSTSGPCELHLQARRATHFLRVHVPPSGLEYSLLRNRLLTQPAFMFRPPGFDDEEFRQEDRTQKNLINECELTRDEAVVTLVSQCYHAACLRRAIAVTRSRAMDRNATIGRLSAWSGGRDASLALATIPRRQATW